MWLEGFPTGKSNTELGHSLVERNTCYMCNVSTHKHICFSEAGRPGRRRKQPPAFQEWYIFRKGCRWCNPLLYPLKNVYAKIFKIPTCMAFNELIMLYWSKNSCKSSHCFVKVLNLLWVSSFQNYRGKRDNFVSNVFGLVRLCWKDRGTFMVTTNSSLHLGVVCTKMVKQTSKKQWLNSQICPNSISCNRCCDTDGQST